MKIDLTNWMLLVQEVWWRIGFHFGENYLIKEHTPTILFLFFEL